MDATGCFCLLDGCIAVQQLVDPPARRDGTVMQTGHIVMPA
jgi:hypothetical protein